MAHIMTLLCAGVTLAGPQGLFPADAPLTASSRAKAKALALASGRCRIWNGPDMASRQTAEAAGLISVTEPALCDMNYGRWSGRTIEDVAEAEPERFHQWLGGTPPPDGEGHEEMAARIHRWLSNHLRYRGRTIAVVSPNVVRTCLLVTLGVPMSGLSRLDVLPLTLSRLTSDGQNWRVRAIGIRPPRQHHGEEQAGTL